MSTKTPQWANKPKNNSKIKNSEVVATDIGWCLAIDGDPKEVLVCVKDLKNRLAELEGSDVQELKEVVVPVVEGEVELLVDTPVEEKPAPKKRATRKKSTKAK